MSDSEPEFESDSSSSTGSPESPPATHERRLYRFDYEGWHDEENARLDAHGITPPRQSELDAVEETDSDFEPSEISKKKSKLAPAAIVAGQRRRRLVRSRKSNEHSINASGAADSDRSNEIHRPAV